MCSHVLYTRFCDNWDDSRFLSVAWTLWCVVSVGITQLFITIFSLLFHTQTCQWASWWLIRWCSVETPMTRSSLWDQRTPRQQQTSGTGSVLNWPAAGDSNTDSFDQLSAQMSLNTKIHLWFIKGLIYNCVTNITQNEDLNKYTVYRKPNKEEHQREGNIHPTV